ncbi:MAG: S41 family peptidase [Prevotella sp.]|nr:S41 family peptidase [Prevotella sp.]
MKKLLQLISLICLMALVSCVDTEEHSDTPTGNFEALWQTIDEHYCFFDYKQQQYGLDWQTVYNKYKVRVSDKMMTSQLFEVCCDMLAELRDGHVNLSSAADYGHYWTFQEAYPKNFSDTLYRHYMGTDYKIGSSLYYRVLDDNIGYVRCSSFENAIGEGNLDEILSYFILCRGLIIDIRNNGGGELTMAERLASRFVHEKTLVGYMRHKTGRGHGDFSAMEPRYLEPSSNVRWYKKVCVLTNRSVYSAANSFAVMMRALPNVTLVGDRTGGGSGMPMSSSLPNGWNVRYSACPMYDSNGQHTEFGVDPDVWVSLSDVSTAQNRDDIIESARKMLSE